MTKAFVLAYMAAFVASRASAFAPVVSSTRTQPLVADVAKQHRVNKPLFMSDDDVSFMFGVCLERERELCISSLSCPLSHLEVLVE